ncbi:broad substrate specificity ATP-binding cassette transporter ABCG2-like [Urocitellus parryii]
MGFHGGDAHSQNCNSPVEQRWGPLLLRCKQKLVAYLLCSRGEATCALAWDPCPKWQSRIHAIRSASSWPPSRFLAPCSPEWGSFSSSQAAAGGECQAPRKAEYVKMSSSNDQDYIPFLQRNNSDLPEMTSSDLKTFPEGAVLSLHNLCYREKVKSGFVFCRKTVEKKLLSNINGIMKPGLNAILAHQSRGKSLLLNILAARRDASGLSGDVLINGAPQSDNFKCNLGYVVQDDIVMGTLTVRENLLFSAALRLPTAMTNHEKNKRINKVIEDLDLDKVANSKVV